MFSLFASDDLDDVRRFTECSALPPNRSNRRCCSSVAFSHFLCALQEEIKDTVAARRLGYYIFWNLQKGSKLAVTEEEVKAAAKRAGLKRSQSAWQLFDRNCDSSATLEEVVGGVEQVWCLACCKVNWRVSQKEDTQFKITVFSKIIQTQRLSDSFRETRYLVNVS